MIWPYELTLTPHHHKAILDNAIFCFRRKTKMQMMKDDFIAITPHQTLTICNAQSWGVLQYMKNSRDFALDGTQGRYQRTRKSCSVHDINSFLDFHCIFQNIQSKQLITWIFFAHLIQLCNWLLLNCSKQFFPLFF